MIALLLAVLLPNAALTPGAVLPVTREQVCAPGYARAARHPYDNEWRRLVARVRRAYGIRGTGYRIDHLVPLELGGSPDDPRNIWPEPVEESYSKDVAENALHAAVCAGRLSLGTAQSEIARDWTTAR